MQEILNVLITDDEPGMRLAVSRVLRDYRFTLAEVGSEIAFAVSEAETGEQALDLLRQTPVDILLLDCRLPGRSGLDVLTELSEHPRDLITVMITAYASIEAAVTATKKGAFDFLAKPFTPDELKNVIQKAARQLILQRQTRRLLEEKNQVRFQFISVLAHELKAPLAAVEGFLKIIRDRTAGNDEQIYRQMIDRSLIRLDGMR
ncbi:MAG TPA: response regulator, partial [bacterium]|nr:response regulator [bacterium]